MTAPKSVRAILIALVAGLALWGGSPAAAQGQPFAPAARINGIAVTNYQVDQRARFLALLRAPNADFAAARQALVDETLQVQAARAAGIDLTAEELDEGMVEFAARGGLEPDQFVQLLQQQGIAPETFRDFVRNGLFWRRLVQARFGTMARPNEAELQRRIAQGSTGTVRVLLSEIALPLTPETQGEVRALAQRLSDTLEGQAAFEQAARQYSRSSTAGRGGRVDWIALDQLAPPIASQVLALGPGRVSEPVDLGSFIGIFLLRDREETVVAQAPLSIDYAEYLIPGGRTEAALAEAARLRARIDRCDDLYGEAKGQPSRLIREARPPSQIAPDLLSELAKLDAGEVSTLLTRDGYLRFVMLCERRTQPVPDEEALRALGQSVLNTRLSSYAQSYLEELRADAIVE